MRHLATSGVIYMITNIINNKIYIGKRMLTTSQFNDSNYYGSGQYISRAIHKYGIENFKRQVILECDLSILNKMEKKYILQYHSIQPIGYNIALGGEGGNTGGKNKGKKWTIEHKRKISKSKKGTLLTKEHKKKLSISAMGHLVSTGTRKKIGKQNKYRLLTIIQRKNISNGMQKLYASGYINNRKGYKKIEGRWIYAPTSC